MRIVIVCFLLLCSLTSLAQRPDRPSLPLNTWSLPGYHAIDSAKAFKLPAGVVLGSVASVAITASNHLLVLNRGEVPFYEFDTAGTLIRSFGKKALFKVAHGLRFSPTGELWITDIGTQTVRKFDNDGNVLLTLGTPGVAGEWDEAAGKHLFNQPNDVAFDSHGNLYVAQGHLSGEPRIVKFSPDGKFIKIWGSRGKGPGQFAAAHSLVIDANDIIHVADRENMRIEHFDTDGNYLGEWKYSAMVCALFLNSDGHLYITSGFDGEWAKLDKDGSLIGSLGSPGKANGQFGEAHFLTMDKDDNVYVADVSNRRVQLYQHEP